MMPLFEVPPLNPKQLPPATMMVYTGPEATNDEEKRTGEA